MHIRIFKSKINAFIYIYKKFPLLPLVTENYGEITVKVRYDFFFFIGFCRFFGVIAQRVNIRVTGSAIIERQQGSWGFQSLRCLYKKQKWWLASAVIHVFIPLLWSPQQFK